VSASQPNNQPVHVPPYYYFASDQEEQLQALWQKRSGAKRRWRSLLSRRSARR
jgi:hypothetical protein